MFGQHDFSRDIPKKTREAMAKLDEEKKRLEQEALNRAPRLTADEGREIVAQKKLIDDLKPKIEKVHKLLNDKGARLDDLRRTAMIKILDAKDTNQAAAEVATELVYLPVLHQMLQDTFSALSMESTNADNKIKRIISDARAREIHEENQ